MGNRVCYEALYNQGAKDETYTKNIIFNTADPHLVHGYVQRGFAYLRKYYSGNICASRRRYLGLSRSLLCRRAE
jgi:hypothetical protein